MRRQFWIAVYRPKQSLGSVNGATSLGEFSPSKIICPHAFASKTCRSQTLSMTKSSFSPVPYAELPSEARALLFTIPVSLCSRASLIGASFAADASACAISASAILCNRILTGSRLSRSAWAKRSACSHERVLALTQVVLPFSRMYKDLRQLQRFHWGSSRLGQSAE